MKFINTKLFLDSRKVFYTFASLTDLVLLRKNKLFILCYHAIGDDNWKYSIDLTTIEKQMKFLLRSYQAITLAQVENHINGSEDLSRPSFVVAFDDGYADIMQLIPLFKELNIKPTIFVLGNPKLANRNELSTERGFLSDEDIEKLKQNGWDIQNHGMTHAYLPTSKNLEYEIKDSKGNAKYFAYPKGGYTDEVIKVVKDSGYSMALTMDSGFINKNTNIYAVPRVGVDRTHTFWEFKHIFSPGVVQLRALTMPVFKLLERIKK